MAAAVLLAAAQAALAAPQVLEGRVERVVDGDTVVLEAEPGAPGVTVRLAGIDAPEICQAHGPEAKQALADLVLHQDVRVLSRARDAHGRVIGTVTNGAVDVGDRMVRDGHAWSHRYRHDRGPYVASERLAQSLHRGLHRGAEPQRPREFRKSHGPCERHD